MNVRVMVDMSATIFHHGHVRLINKAAQYGDVVIGLTSDKEILERKGYYPELSFEYRKEILESIKGVTEVVETPWLIGESILDKHDIDLLVHGADNSNHISDDRLVVLPRTEGISSTDMRYRAQRSLVNVSNRQKLMLTPGPAAILPENVQNICPVFGRGDEDYDLLYKEVMSWLRTLSGQDHVVCMQGSATFALELAAKTFLNGKVLLVNTGYYSDRLKQLVPHVRCQVEVVDYENLGNINGRYDWVMCVYTETSVAFKVDLKKVHDHARQLGAKLYVDATGSIGLEADHDLCDVLAFSSCKGLFGLAGAAFIGYKNGLSVTRQDSFYCDLITHANKKVTGPYHALSSLRGVIDNHELYRERVANSKNKILNKYSDLIGRKENQPLICTYLEGKVKENNTNVVLYSPRSNLKGSIVCHLGEIYSEDVNIANKITVEKI